MAVWWGMDPIDRIRAFNRFWTGRMGLLGRSYLDTGLSVSEVRVLHEIHEDGSVRARDLARRLGLDEGYLSRIVARFAGRGWIEKVVDPDDARARRLALTGAGQGFFAPLVQKSRGDVAERLGDVPELARDAAVEAMGTIERALSGDLGEVRLRDLEIGDIGWLTRAHGELYARDEGFDASFEVLVAEILTEFAKTRDPALERAFIAADGDRRLGSVFCVKSGVPGVAKLRLFLVMPEARGLGLGRRLLDACLGFATEAGYGKITLWTHAEHRAACALYAANGFRLVASKPVTSFGQDLTEQVWDRDL